MKRYDPIATLLQVRGFAAEALSLVKGKSQDEIAADRTLNLALNHLLELVGEAANRIDKEVQLRHPQIPWREMISLRNMIIHGYDLIDFDILWKTLQNDLAPLIREVDVILKADVT